MSTRFDPTDRHLVVHPELKKTNSPFAFLGLLLLAATIIAVIWSAFPPAIRVAAPNLEVAPPEVTVSTQVSNNTNQSASVTLRFAIGRANAQSESRPASFHVLEEREMTVQIPNRTTQTVSCKFPLPGHYPKVSAEVQLGHWH